MKTNNKTKRIIGLLGILLIAYFNICMSMSYKIWQEMSRAKEDGQMTELSQMVKEKLPYNNTNNRGPLYIAASEIIDLKVSYPSDKLVDYYKSYTEKIKADLEKNKLVFDIMDKVSTKTDCSFNLNYKDGYSMRIPNYIKMRELTYALSIKALDDIHEKNYDQAIRRCCQCLAFGKDLSNEHGPLIQQMIATAIIHIGIQPVNYMLENHIKANYEPVINELNQIKVSWKDNFVKSIEFERTSSIDGYDKGEILKEFLGETNLFRNFRNNVWITTIGITLGLNYTEVEKTEISATSKINNFIGIIAKPYILADELYYVKYMNKTIDNLKNNEQVNFVELSKWHIIAYCLIPNISRAWEQNKNIITNSDRLMQGLANL